MKTTVEFLDDAKAALGVTRDTDLARAIGLSKQQISLLRSGVNCFGDETARRIAEVLDIDAAYVIACAYAERSRDPQIKGVWVRMAQAFASMAIAAGVGVGMAPPPAHATLHNANDLSIIRSTPDIPTIGSHS
jgi:transcriptional regulator with XRE-family HTH domain